MIGRVVSTKSLKTATVLVEGVTQHPLYKKTHKYSKKYLVDTLIKVGVGDIVDFVACKPVSKNKHWRITKILGKSFTEIAESHLKKEAESIIAEVMPEPSSADSRRPEPMASDEASEDKEKKVVVDNPAAKPVKKVKKGKDNGSA